MDIIAKTIDLETFAYECPVCWSDYKKNGEPSLRAKRVIHTNGSEGILSNRIENRITHCKNHIQNVDIHITDETRRI
jgi:hypothetical protein